MHRWVISAVWLLPALHRISHKSSLPVVKGRFSAAVPCVIPIAVHNRENVSICRQNINAAWEVSAEVRNRIAVRACLRDVVTFEAFAPKIRAPDVICVRHIPSTETVKAKRDEYAFPRLPRRFAYRSNRAVTNTRPKRVWIEWNKHALTCFCSHFPTKKRRAPVRYASCLYQVFVSQSHMCSLTAASHSASMSPIALSQSSPSRIRSTAFLPALALW